MKKLLVFIVALLISSFVALSQNEISTNDKTQNERDSVQIRYIDTLKIYPHKFHGMLSKDTNYFRSTNINKSEINFDNFYSVSDIISNRLFSYNYQFGFPGQSSYLTSLGSSPRDLMVKYNGNSLFSPEYSYSDIDLISNEFFENIEIYQGSYAAILSGRTNLINFCEKRYNSAKPYTKMWYTQSGYGIIGADGLFSVNVHPKLNLSLGFHNIAGDGRYENSAVENWNARTVLRYNHSDLSSLSLTYNFNNKKSGQNGGLNLDESDEPANELEASVNYRNFKERLFRNDVILSYSNLFDAKSSDYLLLNAFFSSVVTENRFKSETKLLYLDSSGKADYSSKYFGANGLFETRIFDFAILRSGGEFMSVSVDKTLFSKAEDFVNYNLYALAEILLSDEISLSGGLRYEKLFDNDIMQFGGRISYSSSDLIIYSDFSRAETLPSLVQGLDRSLETSYLGILGADLKTINLKTNVFYRRINNPLIASLSFDKNYIVYSDDCDCNSRDVFGAEIAYTPELYKSFGLVVKANAYYVQTNEVEDNFLPNFSAYGKIFYEYIVGKSIMRGGVEGSLSSPFKALGYYPITKDFITGDEESKWMGNGMTAFVGLRLGNAFLRLSFENLFNQYYYFTAGYPMPDRMFHLSFTWAFDD